MASKTLVKLNNRQRKYLSDQMKKVSRSFALVVAQLEEDLRDQLAAAYLICRVVDNIEDTTQPFIWQQQRFSEFEEILQDPGLADDILARWDGEEWPGLTADERKLLSKVEGPLLWEIYRLLPEKTRRSIHKWSLTMAHGMRQIEDPRAVPVLLSRQGVQVLAREADYNQYCYYVAGTVGHLASELAISYYEFHSDTAELLKQYSQACGRGLQKTNIIKDFARDVNRGISYIPATWLEEVGYRPLQLQGASPMWKEGVLADVLFELREATQYVLALPYKAFGYRMASLLCLFPAYQTLLQAAERQESLFTDKHNVKISRSNMIRCMHNAKRLVTNNEGIVSYGRDVEKRFAAKFAPLSESTTSTSFRSMLDLSSPI